MPSAKLTLNHLLLLMICLGCFAFAVVAGKVILESVQKSRAIDEAAAASVSPQVNRQALEKAIKLLVQGQTQTPEQAVVETATKSAQTPKTVTSQTPPRKVSITNASAITGAAKAVSKLFDEEITQVEIKNNQALLDETVLLYNNEYKSQIRTIEEGLKTLGWNVNRVEEKTNQTDTDIEIILGKRN